MGWKKSSGEKSKRIKQTMLEGLSRFLTQWRIQTVQNWKVTWSRPKSVKGIISLISALLLILHLMIPQSHCGSVIRGEHLILQTGCRFVMRSVQNVLQFLSMNKMLHFLLILHPFPSRKRPPTAQTSVINVKVCLSTSFGHVIKSRHFVNRLVLGGQRKSFFFFWWSRRSACGYHRYQLFSLWNNWLMISATNWANSGDTANPHILSYRSLLVAGAIPRTRSKT